jgi:hypothetical protein
VISELPSPLAAEQRSPASAQLVEIIGVHLRVSGEMLLGGFSRLSDFVSLQTNGSVTLRDVTLLNRRGMPTADQLRELAIRVSDVTLIAQRYAPRPEARAEEVRVEKERHRILAVTAGHVVEATVSLYPGADLMRYLELRDPPFLPLVDARVRWLADRRLKTRYEFVLLNRTHVVAFSGLD